MVDGEYLYATRGQDGNFNVQHVTLKDGKIEFTQMFGEPGNGSYSVKDGLITIELNFPVKAGMLVYHTGKIADYDQDDFIRIQLPVAYTDGKEHQGVRNDSGRYRVEWCVRKVR